MTTAEQSPSPLATQLHSLWLRPVLSTNSSRILKEEGGGGPIKENMLAKCLICGRFQSGRYKDKHSALHNKNFVHHCNKSSRSRFYWTLFYR